MAAEEEKRRRIPPRKFVSFLNKVASELGLRDGNSSIPKVEGREEKGGSNPKDKL